MIDLIATSFEVDFLFLLIDVAFARLSRCHCQFKRIIPSAHRVFDLRLKREQFLLDLIAGFAMMLF
jgi:hypothetical protein